MCLNIVTVCPACGKTAEQNFQTCHYQGLMAGHMVFKHKQTVQSPMIHWWSCSRVGCELNWKLHWSLATRHQNALREGTAYTQLYYTYQPLEFNDEGDEACELAMTADELGFHRGLPPNYLPAEGRLLARKMLQNGATNKQVGDVLGKDASNIGKYAALWIRPNLKLSMEKNEQGSSSRAARHPPSDPSQEQVVDEDESESESEPEMSEDEESRFFIESMIRVPGAPRPDWLSPGEVRVLLAMRRRGKSKAAMVKALGKTRVYLINYINAYVVPYEDTVLPDPSPSKRKRSDEPQSEPRRSSKRLRQ